MSLRLEMLQVARLAPRMLGDAAPSVVAFLHQQLNPDGGFADRAGASDLYYTVFGLEALLALRADIPAARIAQYLSTVDPDSLDLVHTACLARCYAGLGPEYRAAAPREKILRRIARFQSQDGAYHATPGNDTGTLYGCFLALGAHQDLNEPFPNPKATVDCIARLRADDGGYANSDDLPMGLTPPTAAAVTLLRHLDQPIPPEIADWLLARHYPAGGFFATPVAPLPDLLSTATALHALSALYADLKPIREPCLDFIDSLWTNRGAFFGQWTDDTPDCEYTYYALLALGHLSG